LFDDSILTINELAKVRASAGSGGGAGSQFSATAVPFVAEAQFPAFSLDNSSYGIGNQSSQSYTKAFNHGGGQFSFVNGPTYENGATRSQFYVQPFTVNQTTGAITQGTGAAIWDHTGQNGSLSTGNWGQGYNGQHCFRTGNDIFPGGSNRGGTTAWTVSNNSVSGGTYTVDSYTGLHNEDSFCGVNGTTSYFNPSSYNSSGRASRHIMQYSGSSISNPVNTDWSSNTSTNYSVPVMKQFGTTGPQTGGIIFYQDGNGAGRISLSDTVGNEVTTITQSSVIPNFSYASTQAMGLELSNGRVLYYTNTNAILLRNGNTLSNVTSSADFIPTELASFRPYSWLTPISQDTWFIYNQSVNEMVKFRVNPTTYKVTIVGSKVLTSLTNNTELTRNFGGRYTGAYVTGSSNQFFVLVNTFTNEAPGFRVFVGQNTLSGA
jgi:hypothetical protein